ncbi:MAG: SHOCT domain-containing protein [Cryobacterium sp.]|nr:SHOCT domain-containing protein [Cryobacterium sp.]
MMNGYWMNGFWMGGGWLFGLLILAGIVLLIILLVRTRGGAAPGAEGGHGRQAPSSARLVLDERYARGELTTEEYQERLRVLGEGT